jgi:ABC-2 type transport system permease protein
VNSSEPNTGPPIALVMSSLMRADFAVLLKGRRALLISIFLPIFILISTNSSKTTKSFGGSLFIIGLAITCGLVANSILGYALTVAQDRERAVFQRLRVTPAPTWTIMTSRLAMQVLANLLITVTVLIVGSRIHHISLSTGAYGLVLVVSILVVMTLLAAVLNLSAWDTTDSLALLACGGYIVVFAAIGIRSFQWNAR